MKRHCFVLLPLVCTAFIEVRSFCPDNVDLLQCVKIMGGNIFYNTITKLHLEHVIQQPGANKTLFAPTDRAFQNVSASTLAEWDNNPALFEKIILTHLVSTEIAWDQFNNEQILRSIYNNTPIRVNVYDGRKGKRITLYGAEILHIPETNLNVSNGVLHLMNSVVYDLPTGSIYSYVTGSDKMAAFLLALAKAHLEDVLKGGLYTVFAPSNDAFDRLPDGLLSELLNNPSRLYAVLLGHIVRDVYYEIGLMQQTNGLLTQGKTLLDTSVTGQVRLNNTVSSITEADVSCFNGVIHIIDTLLLP